MMNAFRIAGHFGTDDAVGVRLRGATDPANTILRQQIHI
jgi:hypothetical protein